MTILRSIATITTAIALPAAAAAFASSSSYSIKSHDCRFLSPNSIISSANLGFFNHFSSPISALPIHSPTSQEKMSLPELVTEFMVDMKCEGCVNSVTSKLETVRGVKSIEADLDNQVVRIQGSTPVKTLEEALLQTGRSARLIGQGVPEGGGCCAALMAH